MKREQAGEDPRDARIRKLELRLAQLEQYHTYRDAFEFSPLGIVLGDLQGRIVECNPAFAHLLGYAKSELLNRHFSEFTVPDDAKLILEFVAEIRDGKRDHYEIEKRYVRKDGTLRHVRFFGGVVRSPTGAPVSSLALVVDITQRVRAEDTLRQTVIEREAAREQAEQSRQRLNDILSSIQDDFYVLDRNWRFAYASPQFTRKVGMEPEAFLGQCIWEMFPKHLGTAYEENLRAAMDQRITRRFEVTGKYTNAVYRMTAFPSAEGVTVLGSDISEQKRAEDALTRSEERANAQAKELDAIIEAMSEGLTIADGAGQLLRLNRTGATLFGFEGPHQYTRERAALIDDWALETPDGVPVPFEQGPLARALRGETFLDYELTSRRRDGSLTRTLSHSGTTIRNAQGEIVRAIITYRDITGLVEARRRLRHANEQLVEADRRKNEFLAVLSHELRNPLAPIKNCLSILEQAPLGGDQARKAKQTIDRQVDQLVRLVDDLLDVTRITRGKVELQLQTLSLSELVCRVLEDHRTLFERGHLQVQFAPTSDSLWICADANRIAQAIGNLLQNAIKFTPAGGRVSVGVSEIEGHAEIRVADTGVGMRPEELSRLFEPFMQADTSMDRRQGGLGLGLALARGMVELHGGSVQAQSEGPGRGTQLTVRLPLDGGTASLRRIDRAKPQVSAQRVLIIEDNVDAADSLCELLELERHQVAVAYDGPTGILKARELRPTVVLCDIGLPGMNGYEVARALRSEPQLNVLSLIALSGYSLPDDMRRSKDAGFDVHVSKPPSLEQLRALIATLPDTNLERDASFR